MKLDNEMDRLTLEHGTMLGPPTEEERAEETAKKKLTNKVGHRMDTFLGPFLCECCLGCGLVRVAVLPLADRPS